MSGKSNNKMMAHKKGDSIDRASGKRVFHFQYTHTGKKQQQTGETKLRKSRINNMHFDIVTFTESTICQSEAEWHIDEL